MKTIQKHLAVILLSLLFISIGEHPANAAGDHWISRNGPPGGIVTSITGHDKQLLLGMVNGLYHSEDEGLHWSRLPYNSVGYLGADSAGNYYYYNNYGYLLISSDGMNWHATTTGLPTKFDIHPQDFVLICTPKGTMFLAAFSGQKKYDMFQSADNGQTWTATSTTGIAGVPSCVQLAVSGSTGTLIDVNYSPTDSSRTAYRSTDEGLTWNTNPIPKLSEGDSVFSVYSTPSGLFFLNVFSTANDIRSMRNYRSTDDGMTWQSCDAGIPFGQSISSILQISTTVLLADARGWNYQQGWNSQSIVQSTDDGVSWSAASTSGSENANIDQLFLTNSGTVLGYPATGGLYRSVDLAATWTYSVDSLTAATVTSLCVGDNEKVFAGTVDGGVYSSSDGGVTWQRHTNGIPPVGVFRIVSKPGVLLAGDSVHGVYRSLDNGDTWTQQNNSLSDTRINAIVIAPSGDLYVGTPSGVFKSTSNGDAWTSASTGVTASITSLAARSDGLLVGGSAQGIYRSTDNGATWTNSTSGFFTPNVNALSFTSTGAVLACKPDGMYRSTNDGVSWSLSNKGLSTQLTIACMLLKHNGEILAGGAGNQLAFPSWGLFKSSDNGVSWKRNDTGIVLTPSTALAFTESPAGALYVGIPYVGVEVSGSLTGVGETAQATMPEMFAVLSAAPNPFSEKTEIRFSLSTESTIEISLVDQLGRVVQHVVRDQEGPGDHSVTLGGVNAPNGLYFVRMSNGNVTKALPVMVMR